MLANWAWTGSTVAAGRGAAYHRLGEYARAIEEFDRAIELDPELAGAYYSVACVWALQGHVACAVSWLGAAVELDAECAKVQRTDTDFDGVRDDPQFRRFLAGLDE